MTTSCVYDKKKKKVLCTIFGCGTRSGRDKGIKRTSVQKSNKNEIFMARVKNSNCLNFCTQVDPSKTRKAVYFFFPLRYFNFREKRTFSFYPLESMNLVITGRKLNTFARFAERERKCSIFDRRRISKILRLGKSYQRELFHRLFVFCKM